MFNHPLQHLAWKWSGTILIEWEGTEKQKIDEANTKAKKVKDTKR